MGGRPASQVQSPRTRGRLMKVNLSFAQTSDQAFMVLGEWAALLSTSPRVHLSSTNFPNEDAFLKHIVDAKLSETHLQQVVSTVLLTVSQPVHPSRWVEVEIKPEQLVSLGFRADEVGLPAPAAAPDSMTATDALFGPDLAPTQFSDMLLLAPTPFCALSGPEHRVAFINPPYLRIIGYERAVEVMGKSIRAILPELEGQPFFRLLDKVFNTGKPYVGLEVKALLRTPTRGDLEERYFDFVYHPMSDPSGKVVGIMVQAEDVTDRFLLRTVSQHREELLYSHWAELEAIYLSSPAGICLIDATTYLITKINETQARILGSTVDSLLGTSVWDVEDRFPEFVSLIKLVAADNAICDAIVQAAPAFAPRTATSWRVNLTPALDGAGRVNAIVSIFTEQASPEVAAR
jgi:PAS domain S-box-containing protein